MKLSIIIPAYNEEKRIGTTLEAYESFFNKLKKQKKLDYEIIIAINNTKDRTEEIVKKYQRKNKQINYINLIKGGKGYAITEGFKDALKRKNDLIGFVDADMATTPEEFARLAGKIGSFDGIIASRALKGSVVSSKRTLQRIIASRGYNYFIRMLFLFPYQDTQCGAKIFKREALSKVLSHLSMSKWAFDVDLLYNLRKYGFKVKEEPSVWSDKEYSKINFFRTGPWMAMALIRLRIINSPFKWIIRVFNPFINWLWRLSN